MGPKRFSKELSDIVAEILDAERITPGMLYDLMAVGSKPWYFKEDSAVWDAVLEPFRKRGRSYLTPYQLAALHDRPVRDEDYEQMDM